MISQEELAICKQRGHTTHATDEGWSQRKACGMWLREKRTLEEREDEPPEDELDPGVLTDRQLKAIGDRIKALDPQRGPG